MKLPDNDGETFAVGEDRLQLLIEGPDRLEALIKLIARRLRQAWPDVRLIVRGDSGFCRPRALRRFDAWGIDYIVGLQKNSALLERVAHTCPVALSLNPEIRQEVRFIYQ